MSKDYSKGYKQGQQDGANGDNNLAMQSFKRLFTEVGSWLPGEIIVAISFVLAIWPVSKIRFESYKQITH